MANKIETYSPKNIKPRMNLNYNMYVGNTDLATYYGIPLRSKYPDSEILFQKQKISRDVQNIWCWKL